MKPGGLRFAPLIRVSTERQEAQGESLKTQRTDLEADVKTMGGTIYKLYSGQEHGTPDYERKILDELIRDAQQNKFDAVIIWSIDRWSRDDLRGPQDLKILKDNGIRFFVRQQEYDLHDEQNYFFIALYQLMGRTQSAGQTRKSILNRIHRAQQGFPTCGKLPFGRTYTKDKGWGIDPEKQKVVKDAARRYLAGESMALIAESYGIDHPNLNKILKHRCGDKWEQRFASAKLNIDETVITKIPRLLSEEVIKQIHQRSEANKTYTHGQWKHSYLLSRMIFCETCGFAMFGQTNHFGTRFYRHPRGRGCDTLKYIAADLIENAVINDIFQMLGDKPRIDAAVRAAIPNVAELEELKSSIEHNEKQLLKNAKAKERLIDQVADGYLAGPEVKIRMDKLKAQEGLLLSQIETWKKKRESLPTQAEVTRRSQLLLRLREDILRMQTHLDKEMNFDDKRKLLQYAFAGKDADGKRRGVYISKTKKGDWLYAINGVFYDEKVIFKKPSFDESKQLKSLMKQDSRRKCHAHHGFRFYQR
jgi:site-specific DNA recombinase